MMSLGNTGFQSNNERIISNVIDCLKISKISGKAQEIILEASLGALEGTLTHDNVIEFCQNYSIEISLCEALIKSFSNLFWEVAKVSSNVPLDIQVKLCESGMDNSLAVSFVQFFRDNFERLKSLKSAVSAGSHARHFADISWRLDLEVRLNVHFFN